MTFYTKVSRRGVWGKVPKKVRRLSDFGHFTNDFNNLRTLNSSHSPAWPTSVIILIKFMSKSNKFNSVAISSSLSLPTLKERNFSLPHLHQQKHFSSARGCFGETTTTRKNLEKIFRKLIKLCTDSNKLSIPFSSSHFSVVYRLPVSC